MKLDKYKIEDTTHNLLCRHAVGSHGYDYYMSCIILKKMSNNRLKVLVFGDRNWKGHDDKKRIRYVESSRVSCKTQNPKDFGASHSPNKDPDIIRNKFEGLQALQWKQM